MRWQILDNAVHNILKLVLVIFLTTLLLLTVSIFLHRLALVLVYALHVHALSTSICQRIYIFLSTS